MADYPEGPNPIKWGVVSSPLRGAILVDDISANDPVNHPTHYNQGKIEVIDFIEDQKLGFTLGNIIKYVCRSPFKGNELEDLKKARFLIDWKIQRLES